jgi:hypothetical protein
MTKADTTRSPGPDPSAPGTNPPPVLSPPIRVIYILGSGRCGSTLLDAVIGTDPAVVSAGELDSLPRAMRKAEEGVDAGTLTTCSCGRGMSECPLWSKVWQDAAARFGVDAFEASFGAYERVLISLPRILIARVLGTRRFHGELEHLAFVAHAIVEHSGRTIFVDSSKNPARGWMYELLAPGRFDVRYVHLVRDGRSVLDSNLKHYDPTVDGQSAPPWGPGPTALYSTLYWVYMNLHSTILGRRVDGRYVRVSFEALLADPAPELARIGKALDLDLSEPLARVVEGRPLEPGHIVMGNRSKLKPKLVVGRAPTEPVGLAGSPAWVFAVLGGWLNRLYGRPRPGRG